MSDGYDQAGLRAIAADAGVDPALISRYFGGKENLFAEVLAAMSKDPMQALAGERATFGLRVANAMLGPAAECSPRRMAFIQLATRSSASPIASKLVRRHIENQFIVPFAAWIGGERATEKAWLTASVLLGLGVMGGIQCAAPAPGEKTEDAVQRVAGLLQAIVDQP